MPLNKPSCRFSICNHLFQFLRGHSKSRPPGEFPYEPFKTLNHSHISYHGSPASVFSLWWCNPFARSAGKFFEKIQFRPVLYPVRDVDPSSDEGTLLARTRPEDDSSSRFCAPLGTPAHGSTLQQPSEQKKPVLKQSYHYEYHNVSPVSKIVHS